MGHLPTWEATTQRKSLDGWGASNNLVWTIYPGRGDQVWVSQSLRRKLPKQVVFDPNAESPESPVYAHMSPMYTHISA